MPTSVPNFNFLAPLASLIRQFAFKFSLVRCDDLFPQQKTSTYVNEALNQKSQIDYFLTSSLGVVDDFVVLDCKVVWSPTLHCRPM